MFVSMWPIRGVRWLIGAVVGDVVSTLLAIAALAAPIAVFAWFPRGQPVLAAVVIVVLLVGVVAVALRLARRYAARA